MPPEPDELDELLQRGFRFALSLAGDRAGAEDLLQEACLGLVRAGGPWHVGYLFAAIRNRFIDQGRRAQTRVAPQEGNGQVDRLTDGGADHTNRLAAEEEMDAALGRLRPDEREALYLAAVEGYTANEIAKLTDRPRGSVLSMLHRAKARLRDVLRREQEECR
jgi:RNA polymerase sigma-70 factor (ECF subfamily)